jgi:hypothetical protein
MIGKQLTGRTGTLVIGSFALLAKGVNGYEYGT